MPVERGGKKSRHGCDRCKQRRVKCDERVPCSNCTRRREHCNLLVASRPTHPSPGVSRVHAIPYTSTPTPTGHSRRASWALDLYLMSHFSTETVHTFSSYPSLIEAWQTTIIGDAASHPFLLHGMLAISALHLASKRKSHESPPSFTSASRAQVTDQNFTHNDYMRAFNYHQDKAMPMYRNLLQQALDLDQNEEFAVHSKQPWPAGPVYAMAVLTAFIATARVSDNAPPLGTDEKQRVRSDQPHEEHRHGHTTLVHPFPALSSPVSSPVLPATPAESARSETIFSDLLSLFIATRGTRVIVQLHCDNT